MDNLESNTIIIKLHSIKGTVFLYLKNFQTENIHQDPVIVIILGVGEIDSILTMQTEDTPAGHDRNGVDEKNQKSPVNQGEQVIQSLD